jgi:hypothetical protein
MPKKALVSNGIVRKRAFSTICNRGFMGNLPWKRIDALQFVRIIL